MAGAEQVGKVDCVARVALRLGFLPQRVECRIGRLFLDSVEIGVRHYRNGGRPGVDQTDQNRTTGRQRPTGQRAGSQCRPDSVIGGGFLSLDRGAQRRLGGAIRDIAGCLATMLGDHHGEAARRQIGCAEPLQQINQDAQRDI